MKTKFYFEQMGKRLRYLRHQRGELVATRELDDNGYNTDPMSVLGYMELEADLYFLAYEVGKHGDGRKEHLLLQARLLYDASYYRARFNSNQEIGQLQQVEEAFKLLEGLPVDKRCHKWRIVHDAVVAAWMELVEERFDEQRYEAIILRMFNRDDQDAPGRLHFYLRRLVYLRRTEEAREFAAGFPLRESISYRPGGMCCYQYAKLTEFVGQLLANRLPETVLLNGPLD